MKEIYFSEPLYATKTSFDRFSKLQNMIISDESDKVKITFDIQSRTGLTFVFCIGTLPLLAQNKNKYLELHCNDKLLLLLKKIGFLNDVVNLGLNTNIANLLIDNARKIIDSEDIFSLVTDVVKEAPVEMNDTLTEVFISKTGEMYNNAIEHSKSDLVVGGKYFKNQKNLFCFSCYDGGCGIPQNVIEYIKKETGEVISQKDAFRWALKKRNSTGINAGKSEARGLGLQLLQSFVKANYGVIRIISGNILYKYNAKGEKYEQLANTFIGTLFEMDIVADNKRRYILN